MKVAVILGSVREGRLGERVAKWVTAEAAKVEGLELTLLDLKSFDLPLYSEPFTPISRQEPYSHEGARAWSTGMAAAGAYIFVTPEYNHTIPGALSNALDYLWAELTDKPAAVVSYSTGPVGGARSAHQLIATLTYLQMLVSGVVNIGKAQDLVDEAGVMAATGPDQTLARALERLARLSANRPRPSAKTRG